jgi:hypothetical protein
MRERSYSSIRDNMPRIQLSQANWTPALEDQFAKIVGPFRLFSVNLIHGAHLSRLPSELWTVVLSRHLKVPAIGILSTHTSRNTQFTTSFQALTKHALCSLIRTILYPQCMQPKKQSSYRRLPRKPPTLEFLLSAIGDAQSLVKKGRATNRDLKSWECKYLRFSRVKSIA